MHKHELDSARRNSILPDVLRNVTLGEIIHAVDIVEEEDKRLEDEGIGGKETRWNTGVLESNNGPVFLQTVENFEDETARKNRLNN